MLAVTRNEYANLFHTLRELFNAHEALLLVGVLNVGDTSVQVREKVQLQVKPDEY